MQTKIKKTVKFSMICCLAAFLMACNSDESIITDIAPKEYSKVEVIDGVLKFQDQAIYDSIVNELASMDIEERDAFYEELGFNPIANTLSEADDELEQMSNLQNIGEFKAQYSSFKDKYKDVFLFNDQDEEDLSPYISFVDFHHELVSNTEGYFYIGENKVEAPKYSTYSEKFEDTEFVSLRSSGYLNHAYAHTSKRKVGLYIFRTKNRSGQKTQINITFTAQKKNFFGWVRYKTVYYATLKLEAHSYYMQIDYTDERFCGGVYSTGSAKSGRYTVLVGTCSYPVYGWMECWSRGVPRSTALSTGTSDAEVYL